MIELNQHLRFGMLLSSLIASSTVLSAGNTTNQSLHKSKRILMELEKYKDKYRSTIYCNATFDSTKHIILPLGFSTRKHGSRSKRVEFEHIVPTENFGRNFSEWRKGHSECTDKKGKKYNGRRCVEKVNKEYRHMQSDMYNLYPAIGSVNASRSNYNFAMLADAKSSFGSCNMKIQGNKVEPPESARGKIARSYLYMDQTYDRYTMSRNQRQLMNAWDKQYPVDQEECIRGKMIEEKQKNINSILNERCQ